MVKNSLALAFSLGGIVAAVSFRNTLRDTKDAVYIFLATGVGLAAGIQSVAFAAALSITYNVVILMLWWTDFGRSPANLQGPPAQRRLQRALALANRTSAFVVDGRRPDPQVADARISSSRWPRAPSAGGSGRARMAMPTAAPDAPDERARQEAGGVPPARSAGAGPAPTRRAGSIEPLLDASAKRWEFVRAVPGIGGRRGPAVPRAPQEERARREPGAEPPRGRARRT